MTTEGSSTPARTALVTGATGYVGGTLVPRLLAEGWQVRVLARRPDALRDHPWSARVEVVPGDGRDRDALAMALDGVDVAYYLIHSMAAGSDFAARDRRLAELFAEVASVRGVGRIVYLGGLHPDDEHLSAHLASRNEVGQIFLDGAVPAAVLQAAVVLGGGSISFQMLRYLSDRLPVMLAPKWLHNRVQPIAVDDLMHQLVVAADLPPKINQSFDVGGADVLTYAEMIHRFAGVMGLGRRWVLTVPVLTPGLASRWIGLVTPLDTKVARPLVDSLVHEVVCRDDAAHRLPEPSQGWTPYDEAVRLAMIDAPADHGLRNGVAALTAGALVASLGLARWARRRSR